MVALNLDLSTHKPAMGGGLPTKPDGWYTGMIVETTAKGTREANEGKSRNAYLECKIAYQDGTHYIERFNLWNDNQDTVRIACENLSALCVAMGINPQIQDSQQLHNNPFEHYLAIEESRTSDGKTLRQNRMKGVRTRDGKVIGNIPAAPPTGATSTDGAAAGAGGFTAAPPNPQGGFAPPQGQGAPQGGPQQPWGGGAPQGGAPQQGQGAPQFQAPQQGQGAPQGGGFQPPQGGFQAPQGGAPQGGGFQAPQGGFAPPQGGQFQAPQQQGGGFTPPNGAPWGGPQG